MPLSTVKPIVVSFTPCVSFYSLRNIAGTLEEYGWGPNPVTTLPSYSFAALATHSSNFDVLYLSNLLSC